MEFNYKEITTLEAVALIDQNKIENLYFSETYFESNCAYGDNGSFYKCIVPHEWKCTDPIKYHGEIIVYSKWLRRKTVLKAEPGQMKFDKPNQRSEKHIWLKREPLEKRIPKPPRLPNGTKIIRK